MAVDRSGVGSAVGMRTHREGVREWPLVKWIICVCLRVWDFRNRSPTRAEGTTKVGDPELSRHIGGLAVLGQSTPAIVNITFSMGPSLDFLSGIMFKEPPTRTLVGITGYWTAPRGGRLGRSE